MSPVDSGAEELQRRIAALAETGFAGVVRVDVEGRTELRRAYGLADRAAAPGTAARSRRWTTAAPPCSVAGTPGVSFVSRHDPVRGCTYSVVADTGEGAWPVSRAVLTYLGDRVGLTL